MKKKVIPVLIVIVLIIIVASGIVISALSEKYTPTKEEKDLNEYFNLTDSAAVAIVYNNALSEEQATIIDGSVYLSYDFIRSNLNSRLYWDANENILSYASDTSLLTASADSSTYQVDKASEDYGRPLVTLVGSTAMVDFEFLDSISDFSWSYYDSPARLVITNNWGEITTASVKKDTEIRVLGGIKSPILEHISKNASVTVLAEDQTWTKVQSEDGIIGYILSDTLTSKESKEISSQKEAETFTHLLKDEPVCLAWHQVTNYTANSSISSVLASTRGVNVMSPTWFYLNDNEGNIADIASKDYVAYCHSQGVDVWGLVSNLENANADTTYVLTHTSARTNLVNQLIAAAIKYELDGINVDFEQISSECGDGYIEFIRELSIKCAVNGICLSVDNYVPSNYTTIYSRSEQALFADYVIIMAYDQHTTGSEVGSVASFDWVSEGVINTLAEVPAEQTILGIPFYTRIWELTPKDDIDQGEVTDSTDLSTLYDISSAVYGMSAAQKEVNANGAQSTWLEDSGQFYAEWEKDGATYKVWLEDSSSIEQKLSLVNSNSLAGAAFWKLGFETSSVWDTIVKYIN